MGDTTVMTTIEPAPAPDAGDAAANGESADVQAGEQGQTPGTPQPEAAPKVEDKSLELAQKWEKVTQRETRARSLERELSTKMSTLEDREKKAAARERELEEILESLKADPVAFALKHGGDPQDLVRRSAKPKTEEERRLEAIEKQIKEREENEKKRLEEEETRQKEAHRQRVMKEFVGGISRESCPFVTTMHQPKEVPGLVNEMLNERGPDGLTLLEAFQENYRRNPSDKEIREELERRTAERARPLFESLQKLFGPKESGSSQAPTAGPPATDNGPSLSNQNAGPIVSRKAPQKLSLEERRALNLKNVRTELEAGLPSE